MSETGTGPAIDVAMRCNPYEGRILFQQAETEVTEAANPAAEPGIKLVVSAAQTGTLVACRFA